MIQGIGGQPAIIDEVSNRCYADIFWYIKCQMLRIYERKKEIASAKYITWSLMKYNNLNWKFCWYFDIEINRYIVGNFQLSIKMFIIAGGNA